ncbi:MAG TPA: peptidoglycan-binding protein [Blastocatellia bacterium]|nr:peptidoglycan-binding protein [Blastocatellia bacterium]
MQREIKKSASAVLALALALALAGQALATQVLDVPTGTVIPLRMDTYLSSDTARVGDRFTATVFRPVVIDRRVVIPSGAKVEGRITGAERAERGSKAGTVAVGFDRLVFPNGYSMPIDGTLTTLDDAARRQIEDVDEEDRVEGGSRTRRAVVFIGGGAGAGAVIGAVAGGAKGAAVGAGVGAVLGTIGVLLTKGEKAEVKPGTEFGLRVERSFNMGLEQAGVAGVRYPYDGSDAYPPIDSNVAGTGSQSGTVLTSSDAIRSAQMVLRDRGYYNGTISGVMNPQTRNAIRNFQRDRNLSETGELDLRTAQALGITNDRGDTAEPVEIINPRAERAGRDSIRIEFVARTRSGGWRISTDKFVSGSTAHVYARGVRPQFGSQRIDEQNISDTIDNTSGVTRVIFHGSQRDITVDVLGRGPGGGGSGSGGGSGGGGGGGIGNPRQIAFLANRLLEDYSRELNVRTTRGEVVFDTTRNLRDREVELLFNLHSLRATANLYAALTNNVSDPEAVKGAADALVRQVRQTNRLIRREGGMQLSNIVQTDWEQFRSEIARITVTDVNLDNDPDRNR